MRNHQQKTLNYALYGVLFGLIFPIVAVIYILLESGDRLSPAAIVAAHNTHPLLIIIYLAPLVLGAITALVGLQSARFQEASLRFSEQLQVQDAIKQTEHLFYEALINNSSSAVVQLDNENNIITCNPAFEKLFGYSRPEITNLYLDDLIAGDDNLEEATELSRLTSSGNIVKKMSQRRRKDGSLVDVDILGIPVMAGGKQIGILGLYVDITKTIKAEEELRISEARFRSLFDHSPVSLWLEDFSEVKKVLDRIAKQKDVAACVEEDDDLVEKCIRLVKILDVNQATLDLFNAQSKVDLMECLSHILAEESRDQFRQELLALLGGEPTFECEIKQKKISGELIHGWLRLTVPPGYENSWERIFISIVDITARKRTEDKLRHLSFHDALTGLYNRAHFEEEMKRLESNRRYPISIIVIDLDNLKQINDSLGHEAGDQAIKGVGYILRDTMFRKEDIIARIGGDEFAVILPDVDFSETSSILNRLEKAIRDYNTNREMDDYYRPISVSYGYASVLSGGSLAEGFKRADKLMYDHKKNKQTAKMGRTP